MARILIIEDNPEDQQNMADILKKEGHEVILSEFGPDGLKKCNEKHPDLVFLDLVMPEMNGIETLRIIKKDHPEMPVIMCSAAGLEQIVHLALRVGAEGYIVKPFTADSLKDMIRQHLNS